MSSIINNVPNASDSDNERYEEELVRCRQEADHHLCQQEEQERAERQARKEARVAEKARLEEEAQKLAEEAEHHRKEEEQRQKDLAHQLEADCIAAIEQQRCKNWMKTFQPSSSPADEDMNLLDYLPLTKRQRVRYLPQETPEARQRREELSKEMGTSVVGGGNPCERCTVMGIKRFDHETKVKARSER